MLKPAVTLKSRRVKVLLGAAAFLLLAARAGTAQTPAPLAFRAVHYDVDVTLHPADQTLSAKARVEFVAATASRALLVELHQDLKVASVRSADGKSVEFERDSSSPLNLRVSLPDVVEPGKHLTLVFDYAGSVSNEDDSPSKGLRLASVDRSSAYLLLPARWFPLTDYPSNRYTAVFKITVPDTFAVAGTGKAAAPSAVPASGPKTPSQIAYTFRSDTAAPVGTFVAGAIRLTPVQAQGLNISVFAPASAPAAQGYGNALASIVNFYSSEFAPLPDPNLTIAQIPDGSVAGFSAPGLLLVSARQWTAKVNESLLAQLGAGQWWGSQVLAASPSDVWLTDGLARYSEALYIQQAENVPGLHRMLEEFAVSALMYDDAAPIAQAQRLELYSAEYRSVVVNKGAMVFQMLHALLGDSIFQSLLHDFYLKSAGKTVRLEDFEKMAEARGPAPSKGKPPLNLVAFFSQWLNSTGVPEFKTDYIVYRTKKGFKVVGKIQQGLETFNMPVEIRVDTEGNPETKTIQATGLSTEFIIDTFGRPKPNGLTVDPNNDLLKSSPRLRVHAAVARGEALAEQGKYFEAIQEYQKAVDVQGNNSLGHFRMAEAMFYQKNYQAAANEFRSALDGDLDPKWTEVWSHVYLGKVFDLTGQRERAVNEYSRAEQLKDDTSGAQEEAARYLQKPYTGDATPSSAATAKP